MKKEKSKRNKKNTKKQGRFLFDTLNITIFEDDIAVLKVEEPGLLQCSQETIWPACLPHQVSVSVFQTAAYLSPGRITTTPAGRGRYCPAGDG